MRYFDLHCDTMTRCMLENKTLKKNDCHIGLDKTGGFDRWVQVFAAWIPDELRGDAAWERFEKVAAKLAAETGGGGKSPVFSRNPEELSSADQAGRNAALLSIEGGAAIAGSLEKLRKAFEMGVRIITLTWNGSCELGDGCGAPNAGGLTDFGKKAVAEMERLGIVVDVSHLSEKGFWDVAEIARRPFIASHSNAAAVCPHRRNLSDAQICEIIRRGGLIGLNLFPKFLKQDGKALLADTLRHADHILELGGERVLAVGADFDGADMPSDVSGIGDMPALYELFVKHYQENTARRIFFNNAADFFEHALTAG